MRTSTRFQALVAILAFCLDFSVCTKYPECRDKFSDEARLSCDLLKEYRAEVRPPVSDNGKTRVDFGMTLIQIMGINVKAEEFTATLYMEYNWSDTRLSWNEREYGNISAIRLPVNSIWVPNIILENSVDGNMEAGALKVNAIIYSNGQVFWLPPSIYKTSCTIDTSLFPFDWQNCSLVFRSASLDQSQMIFGLRLDYGSKIKVDKNAFVPNGEWDLIQRPVKIYVRPKENQFQKIAFYFIVKRKPQFYVLNMLLPCVILSILSCCTFWLPVTSGEKISLSISLLLGDTIFAYLFAQRLPSTSLSVPFAASYLLFSVALLVFCIFCCTVVNNLHYRYPTTHSMPTWLKTILLKRVGPSLHLWQPNQKWMFSAKRKQAYQMPDEASAEKNRREIRQQSTRKAPSQLLFNSQGAKFGFPLRSVPNTSSSSSHHNKQVNEEGFSTPIKTIPSQFKPALHQSKSITKHMQNEKEREMSMDDWAYMAMVLDRFFMWIYLFVFVFGTMAYYITIVSYSYPHFDPHDVKEPITNA